MEINYYEIVVKLVDGKLVGRLRFQSCDTVHESDLYTIPELNEVIVNWRHNQLNGSFAAGYTLAADHAYNLVQE